MPKTIKVAVITHAGGAHLDAYLGVLAKIEEADSVVLADPDDRWPAAARKALGDKLQATYKDTAELLRQEKPHMALVTMEAALAPPLIDAALEAGCHVFAEKPWPAVHVQRHGSYQRSSCAESPPNGGFRGMIPVIIPTARIPPDAKGTNDGEDFRF